MQCLFLLRAWLFADCFFFFKQKTAYEMRISDWSSDVCSSDLDPVDRVLRVAITALIALLIVPVVLQILARYVDFIPRYIWTEEVARFCFIWIIMIGAMIAEIGRAHV